MKRPYKACIIASALFVLIGAATGFSDPIIYSGFDAGSGSLATSPNATGAAAAFDAAVSGATVVTFESALPADFGFAGGTVTNSSGCANALCGYNTTPAGGYFQLVFGGSTTYTFANPVDSFGAYFTGFQVPGQTLSYDNTELDMGSGDYGSGGTLFFGFSDPGAQITSITYSALNDIVAVDDIRYGNAGPSQSVPEPSVLMLLGIGLVGLASLRKR